MTCQIPEGCILHEQSGYCPLCDPDGADKIAEWQADQPRAIPPMNPGDTLIDGDLTVYCGTYEGIRFIEPGPIVCPQQRGAEPCTCPTCQRTISK